MNGINRTRALVLVAALTLVGTVFRLIVAHESLFADELSSYWIVTEHGLPDVVRVVHSDAEITPPLFFVLSWATTVFGNAPELLRAPSLVAGIALIPLVYALGRRTVGRTPALVATAATALAPFSIYYSTEARAYGLLLALTVGSTLALLAALDTGRRRWWVIYAVCSAGAMYSHYTGAFLLATQGVWVLVRHPEARKRLVLANVGAALLFAPWVTGLLADFDSPTTAILSKLSPFTPGVVRFAVERWAVGYPGAIPVRVSEFPGIIAIVLLVLGVVLGLIGLIGRRHEVQLRRLLGSRVGLLVLLALSLPVGEAIASAVGTNLLGTRNLAASWPAMVLLAAALVCAAPLRLRPVSIALGLAFCVIGAFRLPSSTFRRPDVEAAAAYVDRQAPPGTVILDRTGVLSPGPLTPLDSALDGSFRVVRAGSPAERDHPFNVFDPIVPIPKAIKQAVALANGRPVWVVTTVLKRRGPGLRNALAERRRALREARFPKPYRKVSTHRYPGALPTRVQVYEVRRAST